MHRTTEQFWRRYRDLPSDVRRRADKSFALLKSDPRHLSLQFKKLGAFWSATVHLAHRALALEDGDDFIWVWIGSPDGYERILEGS